MSAASDLTEAGLLIQGMHCQKCATKVDTAIRAVPGVHSCQVELSRNEAVVKFDPAQTDSQKLAEVVSKSGYPAKPATKPR
jgi:copper chaperone CopZ